MQAIKWIRKNKQTIMVFVVVLCMLTFVGGVGFTELLKYVGQGGKVTIATYDKGEKISNTDMINARQELEVLKSIQADVVLFNKPNAFGIMDVNSQLLGYLLFGDTQSGAQIRAQLRQASGRGQIPVTTAQIDTYFNQQTERPEISWILLCAEADKAGIAVSNAQSAAQLKELIPQLTGNRYSAAQVISGVASQMNLTNDQILAVYGKMLGILKWAEQVCNNENTTVAQIRSLVGRNKNKIDAEIVKFPVDWFIGKQTQPSDDQIQTQFNAYKDLKPGQFTDQNPYGFGYKLPQRVQLEYFYLRSDDVEKIAEKPTAETMEEYYSKNIDQFTNSTPKDPNNPEGEKITETKSFAEVSEQILQTLEQQNSEKMTQLIFKDARDLLDAELISLDMEKAAADQIRKAAVDFATIAAKITEKHKVPIHTGKTGLMSQMDFGADNCLAGLRISHAGIQTSLLEAVFSVDPQNAVVPRKVGVYIPRMWENIGPLKGAFYSEKNFTSTAITLICRVVDAKPSEVPASLDMTYSTEGMVSSDTQREKKIFDLKQQIADDLKKAAAMNAASAAAEEFKQLIGKSDWDRAVEAYNTLYAPKDPNTVKDNGFIKLAVSPLQQQLLASASDIEQFNRMMQDNPAMAGFIQTRIVSNMLNQKLFDLLADKPQTGVISQVIELKPAMTYYVVKSITRQPATTEDYLQNKSFAALRTALDSASELGLIHFNPAQIHKRMNFTPAKEEMAAADGPKETPAKD
jgi:hypothetical protein